MRQQEWYRATQVSDQPIDQSALVGLMGDDRVGAVVTFTGVVRNHDNGRQVSGIEYQAHPTAGEILRSAVAEAADRPGVHAVVAQHRIGRLGVGEVALFAAASAPHRQAAFEAVSDLVDRIKEILPVWKKQFFVDGSHEWAGCP